MTRVRRSELLPRTTPDGHRLYLGVLDAAKPYVGQSMALSAVYRALACLGETPETLRTDQASELLSLVLADLAGALDDATLEQLVLDLSSVASFAFVRDARDARGPGERTSAVVGRPASPTAAQRPSGYAPARRARPTSG